MTARPSWSARAAGAAVAVAVATGLLLTAPACGGDEEEAVDGIDVSAAWARPTPDDAEEAVVYLTIVSGEADALLGVEVGDEVAEAATLYGAGHQHDGGSSHHGGGDDGDGASAAALERLDLIPGEPTVLEPGGAHVLLAGLAEPLRSGDSFTLTLTFEQAAPVDVEVAVADNPPAP